MMGRGTADVAVAGGEAADNDTSSSSHSSLQSSNTSISQNDPLVTSSPYVRQLEAEHGELKQRLAELDGQRRDLVTTINGTSPTDDEDGESEINLSRALKSANDTIKEHIRLLGAYNDIKDIGQGLVGFLAEQRNARIKEVMADLGFDGVGD